MADRHQRYIVSRKGSAYWRRRIETELFNHHDEQNVRSLRKGRWDPYDRFTKHEDLENFFSGHSYRRHSLVDRERFARWEIDQVLGDHPEHNYEITGEIMRDESVSAQEDRPGALADLADVVRADAQHDVDAEFPRDLNTRPTNLDNDQESAQKIGAAAQAIMAASPNSLGPPVGPCAAYLKATKCGEYGRQKSTVWKSPLLPRLDNEGERRGLLDHQVTGIVWLLSRLLGNLPTLKYKDVDTGKKRFNIETPSEEENRDLLEGPRYFGGILADSMGLGKTLITVALIELLVSQRLNVVRTAGTSPKYRPILLLTPNATVASQWVQEIDQVIDISTIRHIVVSGPGLEAPGDQYRIIHLGRDNFRHWPATISYMWDENDERAAKVVLIMTMESWAGRTVFMDDEKRWCSSFTEEGRAFSLVIVDEAYKVKNPSTRNWRSVYHLERQFTLLITATPCMNTLTDLFGLARLLWTAPEKYLKANPAIWRDIEKTFRDLPDLYKLENYDSAHEFQLVAGRPALLAKLLCKHRNARTQDIDLTRKYLRYFETLAMLKRSPSSLIYADWEKTQPISLEGMFPRVENYTVDISLGEDYDREYQKVHTDILIDYLQRLKDWSGAMAGKNRKVKKEDEEAVESLATCLRLLQIASSSLDIFDIHRTLSANGLTTLAADVQKMREKGVNILRLCQFLLPPNAPKPQTHVEVMKLVTRNSPLLQYILYYIKETILARTENSPIKKLLIIENNLMVAFYYEIILQFMGFECRCLHAYLSTEERQELVDSFNSNDIGSCQILIQLYTVGFAGTNLHKSCSQVLVASQSHSLQVQWQAIYRVIRVGQNSDVTVHRLKLKNSYHAFRESRQVEKILPELGARAQGQTKKVLVRLLNLFQYEIRDAWNSPEGKKLRQEKNLLFDKDEIKEEENAETMVPGRKRIKLDDGAKGKGIKIKDESKDKAIKKESKPKFIIEDGKVIKIKEEEEDASGSGINHVPASSSNQSLKRSREESEPVATASKSMPSNGGAGWYNHGDISDDDAFLELRTRDDYYEEFIKLPRAAKSLFSHRKNNLRRLLSYGNDNGKLSTLPWKEEDLTNPAILERALELMLRVRLGSSDIAMLPFPLIDLSRVPLKRRKVLQALLAETVHTDQDFDRAAPVAAAKDLKETLKGSDVKKSLAQIDRDLVAHAEHGDADAAAKKRVSEAATVDLDADSPEDEADSQDDMEEP